MKCDIRVHYNNDDLWLHVNQSLNWILIFITYDFSLNEQDSSIFVLFTKYYFSFQFQGQLKKIAQVLNQNFLKKKIDGSKNPQDLMTEFRYMVWIFYLFIIADKVSKGIFFVGERNVHAFLKGLEKSVKREINSSCLVKTWAIVHDLAIRPRICISNKGFILSRCWKINLWVNILINSRK